MTITIQTSTTTPTISITSPTDSSSSLCSSDSSSMDMSSSSSSSSDDEMVIETVQTSTKDTQDDITPQESSSPTPPQQPPSSSDGRHLFFTPQYFQQGRKSNLVVGITAQAQDSDRNLNQHQQRQIVSDPSISTSAAGQRHLTEWEIFYGSSPAPVTEAREKVKTTVGDGDERRGIEVGMEGEGEQIDQRLESGNEKGGEMNLSGYQGFGGNTSQPTLPQPDLLPSSHTITTPDTAQPRPLFCPHCDSSFQKRQHLKRHIQTIHNVDTRSSSRQTQQTQTKPTQSSSSSQLNPLSQSQQLSNPPKPTKPDHLLRNKPHKCLICKRGFTRKDALSRHLKLHERPEFLVGVVPQVRSVDQGEMTSMDIDIENDTGSGSAVGFGMGRGGHNRRHVIGTRELESLGGGFGVDYASGLGRAGVGVEIDGVIIDGGDGDEDGDGDGRPPVGNKRRRMSVSGTFTSEGRSYDHSNTGGEDQKEDHQGERLSTGSEMQEAEELLQSVLRGCGGDLSTIATNNHQKLSQPLQQPHIQQNQLQRMTSGASIRRRGMSDSASRPLTLGVGEENGSPPPTIKSQSNNLLVPINLPRRASDSSAPSPFPTSSAKRRESTHAVPSGSQVGTHSNTVGLAIQQPLAGPFGAHLIRPALRSTYTKYTSGSTVNHGSAQIQDQLPPQYQPQSHSRDHDMEKSGLYAAGPIPIRASPGQARFDSWTNSLVGDGVSIMSEVYGRNVEPQRGSDSGIEFREGDGRGRLNQSARPDSSTVGNRSYNNFPNASSLRTQPLISVGINNVPIPLLEESYHFPASNNYANAAARIPPLPPARPTHTHSNSHSLRSMVSRPNPEEQAPRYMSISTAAEMGGEIYNALGAEFPWDAKISIIQELIKDFCHDLKPSLSHRISTINPDNLITYLKHGLEKFLKIFPVFHTQSFSLESTEPELTLCIMMFGTVFMDQAEAKQDGQALWRGLGAWLAEQANGYGERTIDIPTLCRIGLFHSLFGLVCPGVGTADNPYLNHGLYLRLAATAGLVSLDITRPELHMPGPSASGAELHKAWVEWAEVEDLLRTMMGLHALDTFVARNNEIVSIANNLENCIHSACDERIYIAPTPLAWRTEVQRRELDPTKIEPRSFKEMYMALLSQKSSGLGAGFYKFPSPTRFALLAGIEATMDCIMHKDSRVMMGPSPASLMLGMQKLWHSLTLTNANRPELTWQQIKWHGINLHLLLYQLQLKPAPGMDREPWHLAQLCLDDLSWTVNSAGHRLLLHANAIRRLVEGLPSRWEDAPPWCYHSNLKLAAAVIFAWIKGNGVDMGTVGAGMAYQMADEVNWSEVGLQGWPGQPQSNRSPAQLFIMQGGRPFVGNRFLSKDDAWAFVGWLQAISRRWFWVEAATAELVELLEER